jgi:hypothetical protein
LKPATNWQNHPAAVACFQKRFDMLAGTGALMEKV